MSQTTTERKNKMNALGFIKIVESYGAADTRWPETSRAQALQFARVHPTAKDIRDSAAALDAALDTVIAPPASEMLRARILRAARDSAIPQAIMAANDRLPYRAIAATLIVSGFLGFFGGGIPQLATPAANAETVEATIEVNSFDEHISYAWIEDTIFVGTGE